MAHGQRTARTTVAKITRQNGTRPLRQRRRMPRTTGNRHSLGIAPNLLRRDFRADAHNLIWLADNSYVPTDEGWRYFAAVKDMATKASARPSDRCRASASASPGPDPTA